MNDESSLLPLLWALVLFLALLCVFLLLGAGEGGF